MKRIGIIGGIGPESTIEYYRLFIKQFQEKTGTKQYPELLLHSIDMTEMLRYVFNNQLDELVGFLKNKIQILGQSGVEYVALASNTPHLVFDELVEVVSVKMISIVEETCQVVSKHQLKKVGLLGTKTTMNKGFYQTVGKKYAIEIVAPDETNQNYVHEKYMGELVFNQINPTTKKRLIQIVNEMEEKDNIEGIILGGTELPLILKQKDFNNLKVFDTTAIHVDAIMDRMIN